MGGRHHEVVSTSPDHRAAVEAVYDQSFFWARDRTYWKNPEHDPVDLRSAWALDTRRGLSHGDILAPIAGAMSKIIVDRDIDQIAGYGYGSFLLLGAILQVTPGVRAGLVRKSRKPYGFRNLVEGDLGAKAPTLIVDDVVSSGRSAREAALRLRAEGIDALGVLAIFVYEWKAPELTLARHGLSLASLASLRNRD
jgi:orotate phosphoribosyltransferase